jgi:glycerophosphoryl diester phosphodiesterase
MTPGSSDPDRGGRVPPGASSQPERNGSPLVFAHRGGAAARPEHTLDAYLQAIDEGVDGLECDVRLTMDGHLVCIHDRRLNRTSNGRGLVSTSTLADLDALDFGSWHVPHEGDAEQGAAGVLTLDTLLESVRGAGRPLRLLIETKHPTRYAGSVERALADMLGRHGLLRSDRTAAPADAGVHVTVMSFSMLALARMRALAPGLATAYLVDLLPPWSRTARLPFGARVFGPSVATLRARPHLVQHAHDRGYAVYCWTVNEPTDLDLMLKLGVDGVITDRPASTVVRLRQ